MFCLPEGLLLHQAAAWMWETPALPEEEELFTGASLKRQAEFRAGRHCARAALERVGYADRVVILRGQKGEPLWPAAYCGSISHSAGSCIVALAKKELFESVGIDREQNKPLEPGVRQRVLTAGEMGKLKQWEKQETGVHHDTLLFSIKEAIYKAVYPLSRTYMGFQDVDVDLEIEKRTFTSGIVRNRLGDLDADRAGTVHGWYSHSETYVTALAVISPSGK